VQYFVAKIKDLRIACNTLARFHRIDALRNCVWGTFYISDESGDLWRPECTKGTWGDKLHNTLISWQQ